MIPSQREPASLTQAGMIPERLRSLTWDELHSLAMIGAPVWSREKRCWYLITDSALDNRSWVDMIDAWGGRFRIVEHGLREYQLVQKKEEI